MGIYTWTDATKMAKADIDGNYSRECVIGYDCYAKIVCPDDTYIEETNYDGYGTFGGKDAYELVAEWNRQDISDIFAKKYGEYGIDGNIDVIYEFATMFCKGISDEEITQKAKEMADSGKIQRYLVFDWKREIGIEIACDPDNNAALKYPLKITASHDKVHYKDLFPSCNTQ